jgi:hypothetical protein
VDLTGGEAPSRARVAGRRPPPEDKWSQYAPIVIRVDVLHPGDDAGNGLLRRVIYQLPLGRRGSALELVTDVEEARRLSEWLTRYPEYRPDLVQSES